MKSVLISSLLVLLGATIFVSGSERDLRLYSQRSLRGETVEIENNEVDLDLLDFDNKAQSLGVNGIWLLYEDTAYNRGRSGRIVTYAWGKNHILEDLGEIGGRVSSVRYSGEEDLSRSTLNIYEEEGFQGAELRLNEDEETLRYKRFGSSLILTGCEPWTLYDREFHAGNRLCVYPASSSNTCKPGFFVNPSKFGNFDKRISSVKKGCNSKKVFVARPFVEGQARTILNGNQQRED